jgi:hypothetical protein
VSGTPLASALRSAVKTVPARMLATTVVISDDQRAPPPRTASGGTSNAEKSMTARLM